MALNDPSPSNKQLNVFGEPLVSCCTSPVTGFYRDGFCATGPQDFGTHVVCAKVTDAFLDFSRRKGNDLITPRPEFQFPGLRDGDFWCLCAQRWLEAEQAGYAPPIKLAATHLRILDFVKLEVLEKYRLD